MCAKKEVKSRHRNTQWILTDAEKAALTRVAEVSHNDWFSIADRWYDNTQTVHLTHKVKYDRVFDREIKRCVNAGPAIMKMDANVTDEHLEQVTPQEKDLYGRILHKYGIDSSRHMVTGEEGIFSSKGYSQKIFRWFCMDELASSLVDRSAAARWAREGYPKVERILGKRLTETTIEDFRRDNRKYRLTEDEFNRISQVFLECISTKPKDGNQTETK